MRHTCRGLGFVEVEEDPAPRLRLIKPLRQPGSPVRANYRNENFYSIFDRNRQLKTEDVETLRQAVAIKEAAIENLRRQPVADFVTETDLLRAIQVQETFVKFYRWLIDLSENKRAARAAAATAQSDAEIKFYG